MLNSQDNIEIKANFSVLNNGFTVKLNINGNNRSLLLNDITKAFGNVDIINSTIQSDQFDHTFEGTFTVKLKDAVSLNALFFNLLKIRSVKSVKLLNIDLPTNSENNYI